MRTFPHLPCDSLLQELVTLYNQYKSKGLEILAFPCNQFGGQVRAAPPSAARNITPSTTAHTHHCMPLHPHAVHSDEPIHNGTRRERESELARDKVVSLRWSAECESRTNTTGRSPVPTRT